MRPALLLLGLLLFTGCDDDTFPGDTQDLSAAADLAMSTDAAKPSTCGEIITCGSGCAGNPACQQACAASGSPDAVQKFQELFACAYTGCITGTADGGTVDGGAPACANLQDSSPTCQACVAAEAQGPSCAAELTACLTDT